MKSLGRGCFLVAVLFLLLLVLPFAWRFLVQRQFVTRTYNTEMVPSQPVAIVFGAAILRDNRLSSVLRDRMDTAIELYETGTVEKILVSGDRKDEFYDEPRAMNTYALAHGISAEDIIIDEAGKRTYDTCYRAKYTYNLDHAILVTQNFHLPRALFTCTQLGIDSLGVISDGRIYRGAQWYEIRETAATSIALFDILRKQPPAIMKAASVP